VRHISRWPDGFPRIPDGDWTQAPVETLALKYDTVEQHGWYANLDPTVDALGDVLRPGDILVDYSGGTGILVDRLLAGHPALDCGIVIVDASPKFLRLALEKHRQDERIAFRHLRYDRTSARLELLDEVLGAALGRHAVDALVSTNAIHLYYDLPETLAAWVRALKPRAPVFVQSGNIDNPQAAPGTWIIDATVHAIGDVARRLVAENPRFAAYRAALSDQRLMAEHAKLRDKVFLPVRPLAYYTGALADAGLTVERAEARSIRARVVDWFEFLAAYHEGVLGWVGGVAKIEGRAADETACRDRLALMKLALDELFESRDSFQASWTYVTCRSQEPGAGPGRLADR